MVDRIKANKGVDADVALRDKLKVYASEISSSVKLFQHAICIYMYSMWTIFKSNGTYFLIHCMWWLTTQIAYDKIFKLELLHMYTIHTTSTLYNVMEIVIY